MNKASLTIWTAALTFILLFCTVSVSFGQTDWDAWQHRMPITLKGRTSVGTGILPVDVTFSLFADQCRRPERELRLVLKTPGGCREIPFQLSGVTTWTKDTGGDGSRPTVSGMITFFDEAPGLADAEYFLLYGNNNAEAPSYEPGLTVSGTNPSWTVENGRMTVQFHGKKSGADEYSNHDSGQIAAVTLKDNPGAPLAPQTGVMHWNPGVYVPSRGWMHSFQWDPPKESVIEEGPLFVEIRRSGIFPGIPEIELSVTYRIFADRTFIESGTVMEVKDDIGVVALRNNQLVFDSGTFSHVAWKDKGTTVYKKMSGYQPVNSHGDILRLSDDLDFIAFLDPAKNIGAASVNLAYTNTGPSGRPPVLFDNATYVTNGGHSLQYFFRPLVYFHIGWDRKQLITVPKGSIYSERNLYCFFSPDIREPLRDLAIIDAAARSQPEITIGEYILPPSR